VSPVHNVRSQEGDPHDRLTKLADLMIQALEGRGDTADVRGVVMLFTRLNEDTNQCGTGIFGYEEDADDDPALDVMRAMEGVLASKGIKMNLIVTDGPIGGQG
jgi:hypothetical protein